MFKRLSRLFAVAPAVRTAYRTAPVGRDPPQLGPWLPRSCRRRQLPADHQRLHHCTSPAARLCSRDSGSAHPGLVIGLGCHFGLAPSSNSVQVPHLPRCRPLFPKSRRGSASHRPVVNVPTSHPTTTGTRATHDPPAHPEVATSIAARALQRASTNLVHAALSLGPRGARRGGWRSNSRLLSSDSSTLREDYDRGKQPALYIIRCGLTCHAALERKLASGLHCSCESSWSSAIEVGALLLRCRHRVR